MKTFKKKELIEFITASLFIFSVSLFILIGPKMILRNLMISHLIKFPSKHKISCELFSNNIHKKIKNKELNYKFLHLLQTKIKRKEYIKIKKKRGTELLRLVFFEDDKSSPFIFIFEPSGVRYVFSTGFFKDQTIIFFHDSDRLHDIYNKYKKNL